MQYCEDRGQFSCYEVGYLFQVVIFGMFYGRKVENFMKEEVDRRVKCFRGINVFISYMDYNEFSIQNILNRLFYMEWSQWQYFGLYLV